MALVVSACGPEAAQPPIDDQPTDPPPTEATCTNEEVGYAIEYPADWQVNAEDVLPACSAFDPDSIDMPDATDIPTDIAVVLRADAVTFAESSDPTDDPGVEVLDRQDTTVDSRSAAVLDLESTGEGLHTEGLLTYRYVVELDAQTSLIAETHDVEAATLPFDERRDVLDTMMRSLTFTEPVDPPEAIQPLEGEPSTAEREADGTSPMVSVVDVRVGTHDGFDRLVFEIGGEGEAGWFVRYDDDPRTAGKGEEVDVEGEATLAVALTNIAMPVEPDVPEGVTPWDEDRVDGPPQGIITEVINDTVFEGWHTLFVGVDTEAEFLVERFDDPQRIVIDLFH